MPTGKGAAKAFKIATAEAKREGFNDFSAGTPGAARRGLIAEKVAAKPKAKKRR